MSTLIRRDLPTLIIIILGLAIVLEWFWGEPLIPILTDFKEKIGSFMYVISNTAFGLGLFYGVTAEWNMVKRARASGDQRRILEQYIVAGGLFGMMIIMTIITFVYNFPNAVRAPEYKWFVYNVYSMQSQAQYAIMFLFQTGAIYRVCRARSMETVVLMLAGFAFILRSVPLFASYVPGLMEVGDWVAGAPSMAGTRAATLTAYVGALVVGIRALIGKETTTIEVR